ncbi:MAG: ATP-binding protein [Bacilli bacterium]
MFTLNPQVEDIPDKYVIERNNIRLMRIGKLTRAGAGCICSENALLKHLLRHLVLQRNETVVVDMEAGLEHLSRGTAEGVDAFIVVVEPGQRSVETAREVYRLASELGVGRVYAVVNKVNQEQRARVAQMLSFTEVLGYLPYDPSVVDADLNGASLSQLSAGFLADVQALHGKLVDDLVRVGLG